MAARDIKLISWNKDLGTFAIPTNGTTTIEPGDMVALSSGLAIKAAVSSTRVAYTATGCVSGDTEVLVIADPNAIFSGTADANFAATDRGISCDLKLNSGAFEVDLGSASYGTLRILPGSTAGTVGSASDVRFTINHFLQVESTPGADSVTGASIADNSIDSEHYVDGSIDTAHIAADAIDGTLIADDAISLEHLDAGITGSHVILASGLFTTVGGDATETITATGATSASVVMVSVNTVGSTPRTVTTAIGATDAITVTMSGDPSNDHVLNYIVLKAAA